MEAKTLEAKLIQDWHKNGECPEGAIPIVRSPQKRPRRKTSFFSSSIQPDVDLGNNHESDGYQKTGCYNLECPGFVQTNNKLSLGGKIEPISQYGGDQFELRIYIYKDKQSGNWWLRIHEIDVGYWPGSIFNKLSDRADTVSWGGEIVNSGSQGHHTSTEMGSGHFPGEGYGKASYVRNLRYVDESGAINDASPDNVVRSVSRPECYDLQMGDLTNYGTHFFYGGPGFSDKCK
ncbi:hypothetical protein GQ457_03G041270 [Hibiscus cannabinus]